MLMIYEILNLEPMYESNDSPKLFVFHFCFMDFLVPCNFEE
jgi:hypothetical protein